MAKGYRQVSIPDEFYKEIDKFIKTNAKLGYTSLAEFVKVAIREKIERSKYELGEGSVQRLPKDGKKKG